MPNSSTVNAIRREQETMSKKEMMKELIERMDEKDISIVYYFATGIMAGKTEKKKSTQEGEHSHDV